MSTRFATSFLLSPLPRRWSKSTSEPWCSASVVSAPAAPWHYSAAKSTQTSSNSSAAGNPMPSSATSMRKLCPSCPISPPQWSGMALTPCYLANTSHLQHTNCFKLKHNKSPTYTPTGQQASPPHRPEHPPLPPIGYMEAKCPGENRRRAQGALSKSRFPKYSTLGFLSP